MLLLAPTSFWQRNETATLGAEDLSIVGRLEPGSGGAHLRGAADIGGREGAFLDAWGQYAPIDSDRLFGHRYVAHNLILECWDARPGGLFGLLGLLLVSIWSAWKARNGELGGEARAVLAAMIGNLVCQMFAGSAASWFLFALCGFATCCEVWAKRANRGRCERTDRRVAPRRPAPGRRRMDLARAGGLPGGSGAGVLAAPDLGRDADRRCGGARRNAHRAFAREMGEPDRGPLGPVGEDRAICTRGPGPAWRKRSCSTQQTR